MSREQIQNSPIINMPNLYKDGLVLSLANISPLTVIDISSGMCRDSNNIIDLEVGQPSLEGSIVIPPIRLNIDVNGKNGLDTGEVANNTMYSIYIIGDSRYYLPTASIATLSTNASPQMPLGYDSYRLIGYWATDGSGHFIPGFYSGTGNELNFNYEEQIPVLINGTATVTTPVTLTHIVPTVDNVLATVYSSYTGSLAAHQLSLFNPNNTGSAYIIFYCQVASVALGNVCELMTGYLTTPGTPYIVYRVSAGDSVDLSIVSFKVSV